MNPETLELQTRLKLLKETLQESQSISNQLLSTKPYGDRMAFIDETLRSIRESEKEIGMVSRGINSALDSAEYILGKFDLIRQANAKLQKAPRTNLQDYIDAIGQLRNVACFFESIIGPEKCVSLNSKISSIINESTARQEENFISLLLSISKPVDPSQIANWKPHLFSTEVDQLQNIVLQLSVAGRTEHVVHYYRVTRTPILKESLDKHGAEILTKDVLKKTLWEDFEVKINKWIQMMQFAIMLYINERLVCYQIFENIRLPDDYFANMIQDTLAMLIRFGTAIVEARRSPEKLFVLLDMYEVIHEHQSQINMILEGKACDNMRESVVKLSKLIAFTAYQTLCDFVEAVQKDGSMDAKYFYRGSVHPLTHYVMNFVMFLFDYKSTVEHILNEYENKGETYAYLEHEVKKILQALQSTLETKSKQFKDPSLSKIFLMNNFQHMVTSVKKSELRGLLGDDWIQRVRKNVQRNANEYKRISWKKILECFDTKDWTAAERSLKFQSLPEKEILQSRIRERIKSFNTSFEEILQKQFHWEVANSELRDSLILSICEVLLPAYRSFISRFGCLVDNEENGKKCIKYSYQVVEEKVGQMFNIR